MGGAVSSGRDNNELIDNLMGGNYIRTREVERVFRALDRADYMTPDGRGQAYKDLAWRNGPLHMSAPCIYSEVLEGLELKPGLSFLNIGSGTGYFSTLVGLMIGSGGINHAVEVQQFVHEYAVKKLSQFIENSPTMDEFDFCEPRFFSGNGLCLAPLQAPYDRVYCGAGCPEQYQNYFNQLIKVGGILVMPLNDNLVQVRRTAVDAWSSRNLLNVSFATLRVPTKDEAADLIRLEEQAPPRLQVLCRAVVRRGMRAALLGAHPGLRAPPPRAAPPHRAPSAAPRRICIPIEDDSDMEGLNVLHDLDATNGGNEMNALLSLVLSMGQNRVAGALRFDSLDSPTDTEDEAEEEADDDDRPEGPDGPRGPRSPRIPRTPGSPRPPSTPDVPPRPDGPRSPELRFIRYIGPNVSAPGPEFPPRPDLSGPPIPPRPDATTPPGDAPPPHSPDPSRIPRNCRGLLTFEFHDEQPSGSPDPPPPERPDDRRGCVGVPAEVEIYLGKETAGSSQSEMVWESTDTVAETEETKEDSSSEDEIIETSKEKRKKLDSGIGEGTTTSSGSSPGKEESNAEESDGTASVRRPSSSSADVTGSDVGAETSSRKSNKYKRTRPRRSSSGSASASEQGPGSREGAARRRRCLPVRRRGGPDARRVRLSIMMKRAIKELPLPYALKKYVNYERCFQF